MSSSPPERQPVAPPQNIEAEESVLGAMMLSATAISAVAGVVRTEDFYRESHAVIFQQALDLFAAGEPVDAITLTDALDKAGTLENAGGRVRLVELSHLVPATANAAHYATIVREMAVLRGLITAGAEVARLGWDRPGEVESLLDQAEQQIFRLAQNEAATEFRKIGSLLKDAFARVATRHEQGVDVTGTPTGFVDLDRLTSGLQPGNLVVLAARPSMGKSALALAISANLAVRTDTPVAVFTLEMSNEEVMQRLMCSEARIDSLRLRNGRLSIEEWARLTNACDRLSTAPLYVDDAGSLSMVEIRSKARRIKAAEPGLGLVIVDYLQLVTSGQRAESRVQDVSQISRSLKMLAGDLKVPVLALSQLSRAVESRHDRRPVLSDLRESGAIEQDADLVMFVYRDDYYDEDSEHQGIAEIILAKHRNGPTGTEKLSFQKRYAKFADHDQTGSQ